MKSEKKQYQILFAGDSGVGKTALLKQFLSKEFLSTYNATVTADCLHKDCVVDGKTVSLKIWDTAGREQYDSLGRPYYRNIDCCVLVYDITNLRTFESLDSWRSEFLLERRPEKPDQFPFIILGTKVDQKSKRQVKIENVREWCKENGNTLYFEISGKERVTVEKAFEVIARVAAGEDLDALDPDVSSLSSTHSTVDQNLGASNSTCSLI